MDIPREFVTNHLDVDLLSHLEPEVAHEVLVDPGFKFAHPTTSSMPIFAFVESQIRAFPWVVLTTGLSSARRLAHLVPFRYHLPLVCIEEVVVTDRLAVQASHHLEGLVAFAAEHHPGHQGFGIDRRN